MVASSGTFFVAWEEGQADSPFDIAANGVQRNGHTFLFDPLNITQARGSQTEPAVAANGPDVLVTWTDRRSALASGVYSSLIDWGSVDPYDPLVPAAGVPLSTATGNRSEPTAASRGRGFLVVWTDTRTGNPDLYAARVDDRGRVLDMPNVPVATSRQPESAAALATGDSIQLVAYQREVMKAPFDGRQRVFLRVIR